jgi:hypothetical protein
MELLQRKMTQVPVLRGQSCLRSEKGGLVLMVSRFELTGAGRSPSQGWFLQSCSLKKSFNRSGLTVLHRQRPMPQHFAESKERRFVIAALQETRRLENRRSLDWDSELGDLSL